MMGVVVSLNSGDRGDADADAESLFSFGTIVEADRIENGVGVMCGGEVWIEEDEDDCRGRKAPTLTRVLVDVPKIHKYIARRQSMLISWLRWIWYLVSGIWSSSLVYLLCSQAL
jgi:hypothetical protein